MVQRRAADAGIEARIGNHSFRATGITAYLKNGVFSKSCGRFFGFLDLCKHTGKNLKAQIFLIA